MGSKIDVEWTKFFEGKNFIGSGVSSRVYLAKSNHDKELYVIKEMLTETFSDSMISLLLKEPNTLN